MSEDIQSVENATPETIADPDPVVPVEVAPAAEVDHKTMLQWLIAKVEEVAQGLDSELNALIAKAKELL